MEQIANFLAADTLDGAVLAADGTITVHDASKFPALFPFELNIDDELLTVTAAASDVLTVSRGTGGTTAADHDDAADVFAVITKKTLDNLVSFQLAGTEVANRRIVNILNGLVEDDSGDSRVNINMLTTGEVLTPVDVADFTFDGHSISGTPTAINQGGSVYMYHPGTSTDTNTELYISVPATPYVVTAKLLMSALAWSFTSPGLYFGDGTKLHRIVLQFGNGKLTVDKYSAYNNFSAESYSQNTSPYCTPMWWRISDDGTNKHWSWSIDGINWVEAYSEGNTSYLTTTRVGICLNGNTGGNNNGKVAGLLVQSWAVT